MTDKDASRHAEIGGEKVSAAENVIDLDAALMRRDRDIAYLKESLSQEQRLANEIGSMITRLDTEIDDLGDGLIDRLGTCRDLQAVLAEQKALEEQSGSSREGHDLPMLQAQTKERTMLLREYHRKLGELTYQRDRLRDQLAEIDLLAEASALDDRADSRLADHTPELYSLEELMAETVVLTDEDREKVGLDPADTAHQRLPADELGDMVAPEAMLEGSRLESANDGRRGTLIVTLQGGHHFRYPVFDRAITIGRSARNDIQINSEYVSRAHARITIGQAGPMIEDVSSMNGIFVDAKPVKRHVFESGDVVVIGTTQLIYEATALE
ncbi:MAG TPA: FHA domain-containing protein [Gammaproteobacteria bacterium]